jgi:NADH-quinone oxidoreductase subunit C
MVTSLVRADEAFSNDELVEWLRRRLGDDILDVIDEFETLTVVVAPDAWVEAHRIAKEDDRLAFAMFDSLFGVDAREDGFDVVSILYSVEMGRRLLLRARCEGGRDEPRLPTVTHLYRGADFHERETWDMFGIEFDGHPGLAPRILTDEHFEGWPLRKDFHLATREAKPWPGIKEPAELDEDGNIIEKAPGIGEAVGPMPLDELMAEQARAANPELVAAQEADDVVDDEVPADDLKAEAEAVEAAVLEERTASGHVDIADHGAGSSSTDEVLAARADNPDVRDPDEVRAEAAEHRAQRAREIAQDGPVTGTGDGDAVPQGDPDAFGHARGPDETPTDTADVQAARDRGELPDELGDTSGVQSQNPTVEHSLQEGHGTDETVAAEAAGYRGDEPSEPTTSDEVLEDLGAEVADDTDADDEDGDDS